MTSSDKLAAVIREVWSIRLEVKPNGFWLIDGRTAEPEVNRPGELIAEFAPGEYVEANDRCEAERNRALDSIIRAAGYIHKDDTLPAPVEKSRSDVSPQGVEVGANYPEIPDSSSGDVGALIKEAREKLQSYNWFVVDADGGLYSGQLEGSGWLLVSKLADALSALSQGEEREPPYTNNWRSMETAPRDGSHVIYRYTEGREVRAGLMYWAECVSAPGGNEDSPCWWDLGLDDEAHKPTGWIPLPGGAAP